MIRIFLVDDHAVLRTGLRALLADQPSLQVVGEAGNGLELLSQLPTTPTDVVLLDLNMPGMGGLETCQRLRAEYPDVIVLVLSMLDNEEYVNQMLDAGALGYVLKNAGLDEIVHALHNVAAGRAYLCTELGIRAIRSMRELATGRKPAAMPTGTVALTARETEVLQLIAQGSTNGEIAEKLFTSKRTIETHRQNIISKTKMKNTASLIRFAVSEGLVS
jgi:DNA-binding NarL/FixJ family response regulator